VIKRIHIRNFKGIEYATMELGQITMISGANGTGKSSFLEAVKAPFQGGYDPALVNDPEAEGACRIRIGERPADKRAVPGTKAIVEMELEDGSRLKRVIDAQRATSSVECFSATGERLGGQGYVEKLAPIGAVDPLAFLLADKKDRAKVVMEFLNVPLEESELDFIPGGDWWTSYMRDKDGRRLQCFEALNSVEKGLADRRRECDRRFRELAATIDNLRRSSPTINDESRDWQSEAAEAETAYRHAESAYRAEIAAMRSEAEAARTQAIEQRTADNRAVDAWLAAEIAKLQAEASARKSSIQQAYTEQIEGIRRAEAAAEEKITAESGALVDERRRAHEEAQRNLTAFHESIGIRNHLKTVEDQHRVQLSESLRLETAIAKIRELRMEKMKNVGIEGLEMRDGEVFYRGLRLDALNTAQQIQIAAQIVSNNARELPFLIIDNAEHLDAETKTEFVQALASSGFQVVVAEVSNSALTVQTDKEIVLEGMGVR